MVLVVTILFMNGTTLGIEALAHTMGYETRLFDNTRVHTIDIVMEDWDEFIANAAGEEYTAASVVIDQEAYKNVGIRGKGNTSLSTVAALGSERYSFKIEFDQYDSSVSYHGLDKLSLNNLIQDSTMMKDYLTYTMMNEFGVNAPLCSFVYITVNGEDWGLYLAVEGVEEAFLERNYGSSYGELYKPDSMSFGGGRGNGMDFNMDDFIREKEDSSGEAEDGSSAEAGQRGGERGSFDPSSVFGGDMPEDFDPSSLFGAGQGGFGAASDDVKLQYIDDSLESYTNIWNNAKTSITEADQKRLIESLKKLSNGEEIESVVDVEQVIRYFVVHNYVCNGDSYTGTMIHNYYLYEENGQLSMIPWDYNLAFGTFSASDATSTVNTPIDSPVSMGSSSDRPMLNWIFESEEYTELYHQYFTEFLESVDVEGIIEQAYSLIQSHVERDPTAFYTVGEFELGVETLRRFCSMRSESIELQLENGETASSMNYVDASGIALSDMGSMNGMDGFGGSGQSMPGNQQNASSGPNAEGISDTSPGDMPDTMPEGFDPSQMPDGFSGSFPGQTSGGKEEPAPSSDDADSTDGTGSSEESGRPSRDSMQLPGGDFPSDMGGTGTSASSSTGWIWVAVSILILGAGLMIAKGYRY